jgi:hypothetical protein
MSNLIETFAKFNGRNRRPDRKRHMELCGFKYAGFDFLDGWKPRELAERKAMTFNKIHNLNCHVVYWQDVCNADGERWYQFWVKPINDIHKEGDNNND